MEPDELPDDAARREVREETGVSIQLSGEPAIDVDAADQPRQLCPPIGVQLAEISAGHQHIDLVYLASGEPAGDTDGVRWFGEADLDALELGAEVRAWCAVALRGCAADGPH